VLCSQIQKVGGDTSPVHPLIDSPKNQWWLVVARTRIPTSSASSWCRGLRWRRRSGKTSSCKQHDRLHCSWPADHRESSLHVHLCNTSKRLTL